MPRQKGFAVENNFTKGFITEATGLKFPENACTDLDNVVFTPPGIVSRRDGFDFEDDYSQASVSVTGNVVTAYRWDNVAGNGDITFIVTQVGDTIRFYRVTPDAPLSDGLHATTIDLTTYFTTGTTTVRAIECQFASGNGLLFVTNPHCESFYVTYTSATDALAATQLTLQIRDFEGDTADTETITSRPTSTVAGLNAHHRYNLENQGWTSTTLASWDTAQTTMPSNADVPWYYKTSTNTYDFSLIGNYTIGNSRAFNGHFVYSIYNTNRASNVTGATESSITQERVKTCAFFAGRAWYAGLAASSGRSSDIFFSQIVETPAQYGYCYEQNDPASEIAADLLPSDGGVIHVIDSGLIHKMLPIHNNLCIFATNGVWAITGSQGLGFVASDYSVQKISGVRSISHSSFVVVEGIPYWWTLDGIYTITQDPQTNALKVVPITDDTIKTFFRDLSPDVKQYARGAYDPVAKVIYWTYRSEVGETFEDNYIHDRLLTLNLILGAFSKWSVDVTNVQLHAVVNVFGLGGSLSANTVVNGANTVVNGGNTVIVFQSGTGSTAPTSVIKFLVSHSVSSANNMTWAEVFNTDYLDWYKHDTIGTDYDSFFITGYKIRGGGIRKFQSNYIQLFAVNETPSIFGVQGRWDYSILGNSGRWSQTQIVTMDHDDFYGHRTKRIKLRGHGLVMQLKISSSTGNPFDIIGWVTFDTVNAGI